MVTNLDRISNKAKTDSYMAKRFAASRSTMKLPDASSYPRLDWDSLLSDLEPATEAMRGIFLR